MLKRRSQGACDSAVCGVGGDGEIRGCKLTGRRMRRGFEAMCQVSVNGYSRCSQPLGGQSRPVADEVDEHRRFHKARHPALGLLNGSGCQGPG